MALVLRQSLARGADDVVRGAVGAEDLASHDRVSARETKLIVNGSKCLARGSAVGVDKGLGHHRDEDGSAGAADLTDQIRDLRTGHGHLGIALVVDGRTTECGGHLLQRRGPGCLCRRGKPEQHEGTEHERE